MLNRDWRRVRWNPKLLADGILRGGILKLSAGTDLEGVISDSRAQFMQSAANPGLDIVGGNPFLLAKDWSALIDSVLRGLVRLGLPSGLRAAPTVALNSSVSWNPLSFTDGTQLHRWITLDHWGQSDLARELHSWKTVGDSSVCKLPMVIHIIEIGQIRNFRRASLWTRAWQHPTMANLNIRFKGKEPGVFKGWKSVHLADHREIDPADWAEQMWKEGATRDLVHSIRVETPPPAQGGKVLRDILLEALRMSRVDSGWESIPMARNSCDDWNPCSFQPVCYSESSVIQIAELGFQARGVSK